MPLDLDLYLLTQMVKEEWRLHKSLSGELGSTFFPLLIFIMTVLCALISRTLLIGLSQTTLILMLHIASMGYGFFVGGFGSLAETIMSRRLGQTNMLLQLPQTYPVKLKKMMSIFYVKDSIFYLFYTYVPMVLGLGVVGSFFGYSAIGIVKLGATTFLTFMLGMGISFVASAVANRSRLCGIAAYLTLTIMTVLVWPLGFLEPYQVIPPLGYWVNGSIFWPLLSVIIAVVLAYVGVLLVRERLEIRSRRYPESYLSLDGFFAFTGMHRVLVAKEWLELTRSGSLTPIIGGYALHLIAVYFISWIFENGLGITLGFNLLFFSAMVGFLGVLVYSSLTSIEHNEYLNVMPVSVASLVKAKLFVYFIITSAVTVGYIVLIGWLKNEITLIPVAILLAECNCLFVVAVTAYLTGLWTNTMFFGAKTIISFTLFILPVLTVVEIGALLLPHMAITSAVFIAAASLVEVAASALLLRRLNGRWSRATFSYVSKGE